MDKRHLVVLPTSLTDAAAFYGDYIAKSHPAVYADFARQLERDALTLALRLYGESPDTMSPETIEVMRRWGPRCSAILMGETHNDKDETACNMAVTTGEGDRDVFGRHLRPGS